MTWAASLAFYTTLSISPLLILLLSVLSKLGLEFQNSFKVQVFETFGQEALDIVLIILKSTQERQDLFTIYGLLGTVTLLFSASLVFSELKSALNNIFNFSPQKTNNTIAINLLIYLKDKILNIGIVFGFIFIMIISLTISTILNFVQNIEIFFLTNIAVLFIFNHVTSFIIYMAVFSILYRFVPDQKIQWMTACLSGALSSVLFIFGQDLIGLYLGQSALGSTYGAAGSLAVVLVWVYYSSIIIFVGAHFGYLLRVHKS